MSEVDEALYKPKNQEADIIYNREPGIAIIPGSNYAREMMKYEQFPSAYGPNPGNPYTYRPYPKMVYKAEHYKGKVCCMAAPPDPHDFADPREYERADEGARRFTEKCQKIVGNEVERSQAFEQGYREHPDDAVAYLLGRDKSKSTAAAHRAYEDRGMSEPAKREIAAAQDAADGQHVAEVPEQPRKRMGRPKGSKNKPKE